MFIQIARIEFATPIFSSQGFRALCFVQEVFQFAIVSAASSDRKTFNSDQRFARNEALSPFGMHPS